MIGSGQHWVGETVQVERSPRGIRNEPPRHKDSKKNEHYLLISSCLGDFVIGFSGFNERSAERLRFKSVIVGPALNATGRFKLPLGAVRSASWEIFVNCCRIRLKRLGRAKADCRVSKESGISMR